MLGTLVGTVPCAAFFMYRTVLSLYFADRTGERFFHLSVPWWGVIVGYIFGVSTFSIGGRYVAMFLMASGYAGTFTAGCVWYVRCGLIANVFCPQALR